MVVYQISTGVKPIYLVGCLIFCACNEASDNGILGGEQPNNGQDVQSFEESSKLETLTLTSSGTVIYSPLIQSGIISGGTIAGASRITGATEIVTGFGVMVGPVTVGGDIFVRGDGVGSSNTLNLQDSSSNGYWGLRAPNTLTSSLIFELPASGGVGGQILATDGSKKLGWVSGATPVASAGGDLTGSYPVPVLAPTGVISGIYPRVAIDAKGRVTDGYPTSIVLEWNSVGNISTYNSGNVGVAIASPSYKLHVNGEVAGVGAFLALSDERVKKGVMPLRHNLDKIMMINGVSFQWRDELGFGSSLQLGILAQDLEKIVPDVVRTDKEGVKRVQYSGLIPIIFEAFKEIQFKSERVRWEQKRILRAICRHIHDRDCYSLGSCETAEISHEEVK